MKKTSLRIDKNGKITEVFDDEFSIVENKESFLELINTKSYSVFFNMMYNLNLGNRIRNLSIELKSDDQLIINAYNKYEDNFLLILTRDLIDKDKTLIDLIKSSDITLDSILGENLTMDYDELSRLNNKLINIQREFSRANFELKNVNIQLKSIIESIQEYLILVNLEGEIVISNSNYNNFFNKEKNIFRFIEDNNKELYNKFINNADHKDYLYVKDVKLAAYRNRFFDIKIVPIYNDDGSKKYFVITFDDVTKRMKNIRRLQNLKMAFDQSKESIAITDTNHKIIFANQSFISEYGYSKEDILEKDIRKLIEKVKKPNKNELLDREIFYNKRMNGEYFPVEISKSKVKFDNEVTSFIYIVKNIADQLDYEEKLILLAKRDQMTGAYSREAGLAYLKDYLSNDKMNNISILFLDINALKEVNDNFGHQKGDELIKQVIEIINESTRKNDIVARLGGDEFLLILPNSDLDNAKMIKNRIKKDASKKNDEKDYLVSVSIGVATSKEIDNLTTDELINLADRRMYEEKEKYYEEKANNPR